MNRKVTAGESLSLDYRISFADMDPDYRLTPNSAIAFFQDCAATFLTRHGIAAYDLQAEGKTWVISDYSLQMNGRTPLWRESVEVCVCASEISSVKIYFDYRITDRDGHVAASGTCCWSPIDLASAKPIRMEEFMEIEGESTVRHPRTPFPAVVEADSENRHLITLSDIDFNRHMNNVGYLRVAQEQLSLEYMDTHTLSYMAIKFMKQSFLGETLTCRHQFLDEEKLQRNCSILNGEGQEVCRLVLHMAPRPPKDDPRDVISRN